MNVTKVRKDDLRRVIEENRSVHQGVFLEACEGYKAAMIAELGEYLRRVESGSLKRVVFSWPVPEDHTADYNRVLRMIDMHVDDTIEISQADFARYVMDDWDWKEQWNRSTASYVAS